MRATIALRMAIGAATLALVTAELKRSHPSFDPVLFDRFRVTRRDEDAADVAQTAFLKAAERIDDYDPGYRFFSWIYRIAVNEALNLVRSRGRDEPLDDEFDAEDTHQPGPEQSLDVGHSLAAR